MQYEYKAVYTCTYRYIRVHKNLAAKSSDTRCRHLSSQIHCLLPFLGILSMGQPAIKILNTRRLANIAAQTLKKMPNNIFLKFYTLNTSVYAKTYLFFGKLDLQKSSFSIFSITASKGFTGSLF